MAMTPKEQLDIIAAYVAGETIQYRWIDSEGWLDAPRTGYIFNFQQITYRIKPKPLELWVNVYDTGWLHAFNHQADAARQSFGQNVLRTVKFREVLDGDNL